MIRDLIRNHHRDLIYLTELILYSFMGRHVCVMNIVASDP